MEAWQHWYPNPFGIDFLASAQCGAKGDCLFLSLARLMNTSQHNWTDAKMLRQMVVDEWERTSPEERQELFKDWKAEKACQSFPAHLLWIETPEDLSRALREPLLSGDGWSYEGDGLCLFLLARALKCLIGVFNEGTKLYSVFGNKAKSKNAFLLRLIDSGSFTHYLAAGLTTKHDTVIKFPSIDLLEKLKPNLCHDFSAHSRSSFFSKSGHDSV